LFFAYLGRPRFCGALQRGLEAALLDLGFLGQHVDLGGQRRPSGTVNFDRIRELPG
jgi:hypothetical protein